MSIFIDLIKPEFAGLMLPGKAEDMRRVLTELRIASAHASGAKEKPQVQLPCHLYDYKQVVSFQR